MMMMMTMMIMITFNAHVSRGMVTNWMVEGRITKDPLVGNYWPVACLTLMGGFNRNIHHENIRSSNQQQLDSKEGNKIK